MTLADDIERLAFRLPDTSKRDLDRMDCVRIAVRRAFPLPKTGSFSDLLDAIDRSLEDRA